MTHSENRSNRNLKVSLRVETNH